MNKMPKLSDLEKAIVFVLYKYYGYKQSKIAKLYKVSQPAISYTIRFYKYKDLNEDELLEKDEIKKAYEILENNNVPKVEEFDHTVRKLNWDLLK